MMMWQLIPYYIYLKIQFLFQAFVVIVAVHSLSCV